MQLKHFMLVVVLGMLLVFTAACAAQDQAEVADESLVENAEAAAENPEEVFQFTCADFYGSSNDLSIITAEWAKEIAERTDNRVQIDYHPGETLVSFDNMRDAVISGLCDFALISPSGYAGVYPVATLFSMPWGWPDGYTASKVAADFYEEFDLAEFNGVEIMFAHAMPPMPFLSNVRFEGPDDFSGVVIRAGGSFDSDIIAAFGGEAYGCSITELYDALTKGTCDAASTGADALVGFNIAEAVKYVVNQESSAQTDSIIMCMNEESWDSLPADLQTIINKVNAEYDDIFAQYWNYSVASATEYFLSLGEGREVITFSEDGETAAAALTAPVVDTYIADVENADEYIAWIKDKIAEYDAESPTTEESMAWFETSVLNQ